MDTYTVGGLIIAGVGVISALAYFWARVYVRPDGTRRCPGWAMVRKASPLQFRIALRPRSANQDAKLALAMMLLP
jgi:hypothetical protein